MIAQKQPPEVFYKKGVLKDFAKPTRKNLCRSQFFIKVGDLGLRGRWVFFCEFCKIFKNFRFLKHLQTTDSVSSPA